MLAMQRACMGLTLRPQLAMVDGNQAPNLECRVVTVIGGDRTEAAISAASILAKVHRDQLMCVLHDQHPEYGFAAHKGYPSKLHIEMLMRFGPSSCHRRSFAPVRLAALANPE
jgi:ribonuclease HII